MSENLGRYKILGEVGQGGFSIVHRAHDTQLDRLVALKELRPILLHDKEWIKRFRQEARTIARLDHPRIVTIHDVSDFEERLFIVMRLINGPSLETLLAERGRLPWSEAINIITAVGEGLEHAHRQGILHRDLKPANILMDPERGPMLSDFGLAKLVGESSISVSAGASVVGTPHYIAPELWEGQPASRQSDIYALGCILSEMLTGEKVFKGETPPTVMMAHFKPPALPTIWPTGVPPGATNVLKTTLASNPSDRYASVSDMAQALLALSGTSLESNQVAEVDFGQQDITPKASPGQQSDAALHQKDRDRFSQPSEPAETLEQTAIPLWLLIQQASRNGKVNFQTLEDTIADLPPKWHGFLKILSLSVLIIFMLAIANLFTSSYPWFIWFALAAGVVLAFRFVNLLFDDKRRSTSFPASVEESPTTPAHPTSPVSPNTGQQTPIFPPDDGQAATVSLAKSNESDTPLPGPGIAVSASPAVQEVVSRPVRSSSSAPTGQTPSQAMRTREQRKKSGCLWISIALGGMLLILVVGIGGFCSLFGGFLQTALPTVEVGPTLTQDINIALPEAATTPNISMKVLGGQFILAPGAKEALVEGTVTYNVDQLTPKIDVDGNMIRIYPEEDIGLSALITEQLENSWDLTLANTPLELIIELQAVDAQIELGSLSVANLSLIHGAGEFFLSFSEPNQMDMKDLIFEGGASHTRLVGLANARAENITFEAGAGDFTLDFGGELQRDVEVVVDSGASNLTIIVPSNVAAEVVVDSALSTVEIMGSWRKTNENTYVLPGEGPEITMTVDIGFGTLRLHTSEDE